MRTPVHVARWPDGINVVWRSLTLPEFRVLQAIPAHPRLVYAQVYQTCLVEGPPLAECPAGIVCFIGKTQLEGNPFSGKYEAVAPMLGAARQSVQSNWLQTAKAVIAGTFRYSFEEIDKWTPELFMERLAMAEILTGVPVSPVDPNAPQQKQQQRRHGKQPTAPQRPDPRRGRMETEIEEVTWRR